MYCTDEMTMTKRVSDNAFYGRVNGTPYVTYSGDPNYTQFSNLYTILKNAESSDREALIREAILNGNFPNLIGLEMNQNPEATPAPVYVPTPEEILLRGIQKLMDFFTEFSFTPSFRFTNTFSFMACQGKKAAMEYVRNYFSLMDSAYIHEVAEKVKSPEFSQIVADVAQYGAPATHINNRLKVYFGPAGTGKTTVAQTESENRCIVCNSSMLPSDLMEDFIFSDGNPDFNPSLLWNCMEQGKTIVLDEINLLPFDSLRFLQGIADGKTEFYYKNRPVHIKEGFQIIGTMNLSLGGMVYGLPEPLVDRCAVTKEYTLSAKQLAQAVAGWGNI